MADKSFGIRELNLIGSSGTPTIESPNDINLNASTVAISTNLTVGNKVSVLSTGIVTSVSGVVTFYGDGAYLTGIDHTAIKDSDGNIKVQANGNGAVVTGILTANVEAGQLDVTGVSTFAEFAEFSASVGIGTTNTSSVDSTNTKALAVGIVTSYDSFNTNIVTDKIKLGYHNDIELHDGNPALQVVGVNSATSTLAVYRYEGNDQSPTLDFIKSRNATPDSNTLLQPGDELGKITFNGDDGSSISNAGAEIKAIVGTTVGSDTTDMPGSLVFLTSPDDENTPKEALRIDYEQNIGIGTAIPTDAATNQQALLAVAGIITAHKLYVGGLEVTGDGGGGGSLDEIVEDTTPQLGGDLDGNSKNIHNVGIATVGFATATDVWVSGAVTATKFYGDGTGLTGIAGGHWDKTDVGINTSDKVGIGTTNPLADLQVGTGITMYGNTGIISATSFVGSGASLTALPLLTNSKSVITPNYNYQPPGTFTVYLSARYNVHFIHYYIDTGQWNSGVSADRNGYLSGADSDININLGDTIVLNLSTGDGVEALNEAAGPTWIKTGPLGSYSGDTGDDNGVGTGDDTNPTATNNGDDDCISTITWTPTVAGTYYYQNEDRVNMWGKIIVSSSPADLADSSFITDINFNSEGRVTGVVTFNGMLQAAKNARGIVQIYDDNNLTITTSGILSVSDSLNLSGIVTVSDTIKVGTAITASAGIITATKFVAEGSTGYLKADGTVDSGTFADGAIANVVDDTTPQLGGDLDGNSKNISGVGIITATSYYGDGQYLSNIVATGAGGQGGASIDNGSIVGTALSISGISTFTGNLNVDSNLFVGYSTSIHLQLGYDPYIQQVGTDLESSTSAIYNFSNATTSPRLAFVKSRSSDPNLRSKVNNGDELGRITFIGDDGSDIANGGAQISAIVDGTASATADMPARLSFYTAEDGTSWAKPRLTIKNTGDVAIGTITPYINASYTSLTVGGSVAGRKGLIELNDGSDVARAHLYTDGGDFKVSTVGTAGTIRFITGGSPTERLNITSAGKVGINSTSPTYALEVDGGTQNTVIVARSSDAKAAISFVDNTSGGYGRATIGGEGDEVYITSGAGVETLRITSDGDVGIGTDNPVGAAATTNNTKVLAVGIVTAQTYFGDGSNLTNVGGGGGTVESTGDFVGLIKEEFNVTAGKLSASPNIYLEDGMVHWFTTAETATSTPNIRYNGSTDLTTKMSVGQVATVTIITQSSGSSGNAYSANIEIDGDAVTEEWLCATAPSSPAATSGYNIYTHTIIKKGSSGTTADDFLVLSTVANYD